ncbi:MAG: hypothetical protein PsegKO_02190 [Pseudohongiellaceae bacterium]
MGSGRFALRQVCPAVAYCLRVPERECLSILRGNRSFLQQVEQRRNKRQSRAALRQHLHSWQFPQQQAYRQLVARDSRPRIIASYHFGDFVYGMNLLLRDEVDQRPCRVLTLQPSSPVYFHNMARAFGERGARPENQLPMTRTSLRELSAFLRHTQGTLVTFCDLPPGFGATTEVHFLGRRAWFPRGAATLALRNRVPLLPAVNCYRNGQHQLLLAAQIEPGEYRQLEPGRAVQAITQRLVNLLQECLQQSPEQWRYLAALPGYFQPPRHQVSAQQGEPETRQRNSLGVLHAGI